jgi:hypothetical protein
MTRSRRSRARSQPKQWAGVDIGDDTPLRLAEAAAIAFPTGSMTESGLRREAARGRLSVERIAGKDFTTLAPPLVRRAVGLHISRLRTPSRADRETVQSTTPR